MNIKDVLIDSILSKDTLRLLRLDDDKPKEEPEPEPEPYIPPDPITLEKLKEVNDELGLIYTCFPESSAAEFEGRTEFPNSYVKVSPKEKLLLLFAENFRRQFKENYSKRRPLLLAVANECNVQKFVSTTIRPTVFLFPELIDSWENCAKFVADHVLFETLPKPTSIVSRNNLFIFYI